MATIVLYRSLYGSTKQYAEWIATALNCEVRETKRVKIEDIMQYDTIILGGGLYAETIAGVKLITKNFDKLADKKLIVFSVGITPLDCREYYDKLVLEKNFTPEMLSVIRVYNFLGKMIVSELSVPHRAAIKMLRKLMSEKENPTEMEKLLVRLCDVDADLSDKNAIDELVEYAKKKDV